jgi:hypothetical protein
MTRRDDIPPDAAELARSERGRELVAEAVADPRSMAPAALRESIEQERARAAASARAPARRRFRAQRRRPLAAAGAVAAVLVAVVVVGLIGGGEPGEPAFGRVVAVSRLAPERPAPAVVPGVAPARLNASVEGLHFPDWRERFAWEATGRRDDRVGGRAVTTVAYRNPRGATLGYAIVAGEPIGGAPAGEDVVGGDETYRVAHAAGRTTVTWTQDGHTCVIDAPSTVPDAKLLELASWANV